MEVARALPLFEVNVLEGPATQAGINNLERRWQDLWNFPEEHKGSTQMAEALLRRRSQTGGYQGEFTPCFDEEGKLIGTIFKTSGEPIWPLPSPHVGSWLLAHWYTLGCESQEMIRGPDS